MRVGIIQPSFIPWRGYFDFIQSVDLFILLDDVQYTRRDWRNRNKIKTPQGAQWLVVPVHDRGQQMNLMDTQIDEAQPWRRKHLGSWQVNYADAPAYADVQALLQGMGETKSLNELNQTLTQGICDYLDIRTPIVRSSDYGIAEHSSAKLMGLLKAVGAQRYLSGPSADDYLDKALFAREKIALEYKQYDYPPYPQLWGEYDGAVSVLDLIANCGSQAKQLISSRTPNQIVVEA